MAAAIDDTLGTGDATVGVALDDELVAHARAQDVPNEYLRIPGGGHGFVLTGFFSRKVVGAQTPFDRLLDFAQRAL
jgi:hypothetical protein